MIPSDSVSEDSPAPLDALVENHRAFLRYLERRAGDPELAEDILQDAFIKVMDRPDQAPAGEGLIPWFERSGMEPSIAFVDARRQAAPSRRSRENWRRTPRRPLKSKRKRAPSVKRNV